MQVEQDFVFAELGKLYLEKRALQISVLEMQEKMKAQEKPAPISIVDTPLEHG
jgi:hypothetical protein